MSREAFDDEAPHAAIGYGQPPRDAIVPSTRTCVVCGVPVAQTYYRLCAVCEGAKNRAASDRLRDAIRAAKSNPPRSPDEQREVIRQLTSLGHPFPAECVESIASKPVKPAARKRLEEY